MPPASQIRREFAALASRDPVPLAHAALMIAKEEYPELEVEQYLDRLAVLARDAEKLVRAGADTIERVHRLSYFLFEHMGFAGNRERYGDPRNSYLNDVLDRRLGIPITLSVVYLEVGRRLGLDLHGVSFPAHFLVKAVDQRGELVIDPFNGGALLTLEEIRARLVRIYGQPVEVGPEVLKAADSRYILVRMLRNLKHIHLSAGDWVRALAALDRMLLLKPRLVDELLERASLYERLECFKAALDDFQTFLSRAPEHAAADEAREAAIRCSRRVARLS